MAFTLHYENLGRAYTYSQVLPVKKPEAESWGLHSISHVHADNEREKTR